MNKFQKVIQSVFIRSWWVIAFLLLCLIVYEQGLKARNLLYQQLTENLAELQHEKLEALREQKNLQLQVNSQSDLAWIELTLMKGLGVVPEGMQKVYFLPDERCHSHRHHQNSDEQTIQIN